MVAVEPGVDPVVPDDRRVLGRVEEVAGLDDPGGLSRVLDAFVQALATNARVTQTDAKRARVRVLSHPNALRALVRLAL
jgi:hypothetical protein